MNVKQREQVQTHHRDSHSPEQPLIALNTTSMSERDDRGLSPISLEFITRAVMSLM